MSCAAFAPHCWNETSRAEPEYVIDRTLPSALCAFAMTVLASCAIAIPARDDAQSAASASFFTIVISPFPRVWESRTRPDSICATSLARGAAKVAVAVREARLYHTLGGSAVWKPLLPGEQHETCASRARRGLHRRPRSRRARIRQDRDGDRRREAGR